MFKLTNGEGIVGHDHLELNGRQFFADAEDITDDSGYAPVPFSNTHHAAAWTNVNYLGGVSVFIEQRLEPTMKLTVGGIDQLVDTFDVRVLTERGKEPAYKSKVWSGFWLLPFPFYEKRAANVLGAAEKIAREIRPVAVYFPSALEQPGVS